MSRHATEARRGPGAPLTIAHRSAHPGCRASSRAGAAALVATVVLAGGLMSSCAPTVTAPSMVEGLAFPSPLAGPGVPALEPKVESAVARGWRQLAEGVPGRARETAAALRGSAPSRLLALQSELTLDVGAADSVASDLQRLLRDEPDYAAAWITLSVAAERAGLERLALQAARRGATLWPVDTWRTRARELEARFVDRRLESAQSQLEAGEYDDAISLARRVLDVEPEDHDALLTVARAQLAAGSPSDAEATLAGIANDPRAVLLLGKIAEQRQDWQTAMTLYDSLPAGHPERASALYRTRTRWRLANAAPWVHQALAAEHLDRAQLATLLVALAPRLLTVDGGEVPVLSDIVDLPNQSDVITAVRLGLLDADPLEHRFQPGRPVTVAEARRAVEAVAHLLDLPEPVWCSDTVVTSCQSLDEPVSGHALAAVVTDLEAPSVDD